MVYIPPGEFQMGSQPSDSAELSDETPHSVTLTNGFYLGKTEVTVGQWRMFINETGYVTQAEKNGGTFIWDGYQYIKDSLIYWDNPGFPQTDDHPVTCLAWDDMRYFFDWLNKCKCRINLVSRIITKINKEYGKIFMLPTEAEWEYACRAGINEESDSVGLDTVCWYRNNSNQITHPVAQKKSNKTGIFDMQGNVWEWCCDVYDYYPQDSAINPKGPGDGAFRVFRGGGWPSDAKTCRSSNRDRCSSRIRFPYIGFRIASHYKYLNYHFSLCK